MTGVKHTAIRKFLTFLFVVGLIGGMALLAVSWRTANQHISPAPSHVGAPPADFPLALEDVRFRTRDGLTLHGWYGRAEDERGTAILLHPYRGNRTVMLSRAQWYAERGFSVFLYDARATGESEGDRITIGYHEVDDLTAALHWVRERGAERIVCHGVSQGGATILLAASRLGDVAAVICEGTYDTALNAIDRRFRHRVGLPGWLAGIFYRPFLEMLLGLDARDISPVDHIADLPCPVFIISGVDDRHTWEEDTRSLYEAAREPKKLWLAPDAGHIDLMAAHPDEYSRQLEEFIDTTVPIID